MIVGAGFGEETIFRGYLFERLGKLFGTGPAQRHRSSCSPPWCLHCSITPSKGFPDVEQATIVGLVFGTIFAITGRIWMLMWAHAAFDLTALAIIYWNLEVAVAHLVFK